MRFVAAALILWASTAHGDVLGLKLGMTTAQVKAAKPCKAPVANAAKLSLTCKAIAFAGTKMDAELWVPRTGLARIGLKTRIGAARKDAESAADAILDKLVADYGPLDMIGAGQLKTSAALFDNADRTFARFFNGKLKADSVFTANHAPDDTMKISGKLIRDRSGYAIELSFATP
jgi:hypothetical protein